MSLHTFERLSCSQGSTRTHRRKPSQRAQAAESPSPPKVWVSTASSWSMCAPSRCKRTRHLKVKRKSRPALCVSTAKRCCCHQDGGRGRVDGHLQEHKKMKVVAAKRVTMSLRARQFSLIGDHIILTVESAPAWPPPAGTCQPTCPQTGRFRGGACSRLEVLGRAGEGSRRLMWTRRVA